MGNAIVTVLFEDQQYVDLLPLVYFRPVWELRCGALPLEAKISSAVNGPLYYSCRDYLATYYLPAGRRFADLTDESDILLINGRWLAKAEDLHAAQGLIPGSALIHREDLLAVRGRKAELCTFLRDGLFDGSGLIRMFRNEKRPLAERPSATLIRYLWDALALNGEELIGDFQKANLPPVGKRDLGPGVNLLCPENISVGKGTIIKPGVVIDAESGPVWIEDQVTVMPNATLVGPLYVGSGSTIKIGAKIYGNSSIGPVCKIGGEVEGCIIQGYSNKQHDGFLGHSYLGCWVNLGADTNNSDLKNNYGPVRVMVNGRPVDSGQRFVGLMMGDHSKTAINTMFNTGTVVGVCCNVFGAAMPPKFVPSFSWGGAERLIPYDFAKALEVARIVTARRQVDFGEREERVFQAVRNLAAQLENGSLL